MHLLTGHVSIHAPAWGATSCLAPLIHYQDVSIHAPAWGASLETCQHLLTGHVSIPAPGGGDHLLGPLIHYQDVSITPPRGGTIVHAPHWDAVRVSIHAPAGGDTDHRPVRCFNPRPRVGDATSASRSALVSPFNHAPAWGATDAPDTTEPSSRFQSSPRVGTLPSQPLSAHPVFQSTPPVGARGALTDDRPAGFFNPRPRVGRTSSPAASSCSNVGFNHAAAWGRLGNGRGKAVVLCL